MVPLTSDDVCLTLAGIILSAAKNDNSLSECNAALSEALRSDDGDGAGDGDGGSALVEDLYQTVLERLILRRLGAGETGELDEDNDDVLIRLSRLASSSSASRNGERTGRCRAIDMEASSACYGMCLLLCRNLWVPLRREVVIQALPVVLSCILDTNEQVSRNGSWSSLFGIPVRDVKKRSTVCGQCDDGKSGEMAGQCENGTEEETIWKELLKSTSHFAAISLLSTYEQTTETAKDTSPATEHIFKQACQRSVLFDADLTRALDLQHVTWCAALIAIASSVYGVTMERSGDFEAARQEFVLGGGLEGLLLSSSGHFIHCYKRHIVEEPSSRTSTGGNENDALDQLIYLRTSSSDILDHVVPLGDFLRLSSLRRKPLRHNTAKIGPRGDGTLRPRVLKAMRTAGSEMHAAIEGALRGRIASYCNNKQVGGGDVGFVCQKGFASNGNLSSRLDSARGCAKIEAAMEGSSSRQRDYKKDEYKRAKRKVESMKRKKAIKGIKLDTFDELGFVQTFIARGMAEEAKEGLEDSDQVESELQRRERLLGEGRIYEAAEEELARKRHVEESRRLIMKQKEDSAARSRAYNERLERDKKWNRWAISRKSQLAKQDLREKMEEERSMKRRKAGFKKLMLTKQMEETEREKDRARQDAMKVLMNRAEKKEHVQQELSREVEAMCHEDRRERARIAKERERIERREHARRIEEDRRREKLDRFREQRHLMAKRLTSGQWLKREGLVFYTDSEN